MSQASDNDGNSSDADGYHTSKEPEKDSNENASQKESDTLGDANGKGETKLASLLRIYSNLHRTDDDLRQEIESHPEALGEMITTTGEVDNLTGKRLNDYLCRCLEKCESFKGLPLHYALIACVSDEVLVMMIEKYPEALMIPMADKEGYTMLPLHFAVQFGASKGVVSALFQTYPEAAKTPMTDKEGYTMLPIGDWAFQECNDLTKIVFPKDCKIKSIGKYSLTRTNIKSIEIPSSLESIGDCAFQYFNNLTKIVFPKDSKIKSIGEKSFAGTNIESIEIPSSVESIGDYAFDECKNLTKILFPKDSKIKSIGQKSFQNTNIESIEIPSSVESIGYWAFYECKNLTKIVFPKDSKIKSIGEKSFAGTNIESIEIPSSVESIGGGAYHDCKNLTKIVFPEDCKFKSIGKSSFAGTNIENIEIPSSVESIGDQAFFECKNLTKIVFSEDCKIKSIGYGSFQNTNIQCIEIPSSLESIGDEAFYECKNLTKIVFSEDCKIKSIGKRSFQGTNIESIEIPSSVESIGVCAFRSCKNLTKIVFPRDCKKRALRQTNIENIEIPSSVESIGDWAFYECNNLTKIVFPKDSKIKSIGYGSFQETNIQCIEIPSSLESIGDEAFYECKNLTKIVFPKDCKIKSIGQGSLTRTNIKSIEIPSSVESIGDQAFYECNNLTKIVFPRDSKIKSIGIRALSQTNIESIEIPSSVESIGDWVFYECKNLTKIVFPKDSKIKSIGQKSFAGTNIESIEIPSSVESIGGGAYHDCKNLTKIVFTEDSKIKSIGQKSFQGTNIESIEIPSSVESIGDWAFYECKNLTKIVFSEDCKIKSIGKFSFEGTNIESIEIPSSVESIGVCAFLSCKNLTKIVFPRDCKIKSIDNGTLSQTNIENIEIPSSVESIGDGAFYECKNLSKMVFPEDCKINSIGKFSFQSTNIESIEIPSSVESIGERAFKNCQMLSEVVFSKESSIISLGIGAFVNCCNLNYVESMTNNVHLKELSDYLFQKCSHLRLPQIPSSVEKIGENAFQGCRFDPPFLLTKDLLNLAQEREASSEHLRSVPFYVKHVIIHPNVKTVPSHCFQRCRELKQIDFHANLTSIGDEAFQYCPLLQVIKFPDSLSGLQISKLYAGIDTVVVGPNSRIDGNIEAELIYVDEAHCLFKKAMPLNNMFKLAYWGCLPTNEVSVDHSHEMLLEEMKKELQVDSESLKAIENAGWRTIMKIIQSIENGDNVSRYGLTDMEQYFWKIKDNEVPLALYGEYIGVVPKSEDKKVLAKSLYNQYIGSDNEESLAKSLYEQYIATLTNLPFDDPCHFNQGEYDNRCITLFGYILKLFGKNLSNGSKGMTALHVYLKCGHSDLAVIKWMVEKYSAAIMVKDEWGNYPIHYFCKYRRSVSDGNDLEILRLLVGKSKGVVLVANKEGETPFSNAINDISWSGLQYLYSVQPIEPFGEKKDIIIRLKEEYMAKMSKRIDTVGLDTSWAFPPDEQNGWVKFVSNHIDSESAKTLIDIIEDEAKCCRPMVEILASAKTADNRCAMDVAILGIKNVLQERLLFLKRYQISKSHVLHKSATCIVVEAEDAKMNEYYEEIFKKNKTMDGVMHRKEFGSALCDLGLNLENVEEELEHNEKDTKKDDLSMYFKKADIDGSNVISEAEFIEFCMEEFGNKVVLKIMKHKEQFIREIESRGNRDGRLKCVMKVIRSHTDKIVEELQNTNCDVVVNKCDVVVDILPVFTKQFFSNSTAPQEKETDLIQNVQKYKYIIVMTKGDRNLDSIFRSERPGMNSVRVLMKEVAEGLMNLHQAGIIHGDIKMLNIVRETHSNRLRLIDLDAAAPVKEPITSKFSSGVLPPELIGLVQKKDIVPESNFDKLVQESSQDDNDKEQKKFLLWDDERQNAFLVKNVYSDDHREQNPSLKYLQSIPKSDKVMASTEMDVWAYGAILYCLCSGRTLFDVNRDDDISSFAVMSQLYSWDRYTKKEKLRHVKDDDARELLNWILQKDPKKRPSLQAILEDAFFHPKNYGAIHKELVKIDQKLDVVVEKLDKIQKDLNKANIKLTELLKGSKTPRLILVLPPKSTKKDGDKSWWWKSLNKIKEGVTMTQKTMVCFVCPITYKIPEDNNGNPMGYEKEIPADWVKKWGPRIIMTLKVTQFALAVGRMSGLPFISTIEGVTTRVKDSVTDHLSLVTGLLVGISKEPAMKEILKGNDFFSTGMDLATGETNVEKIVVGDINDALSKDIPLEKKKMVEESSEYIRKFVGDLDEEKYKSTFGLVLATHGDTTEYVHPSAKTFYEKFGEKSFDMSSQDFQNHLVQENQTISDKKEEELAKQLKKFEDREKEKEDKFAKQLKKLEKEKEEELAKMAGELETLKTKGCFCSIM